MRRDISFSQDAISASIKTSAESSPAEVANWSKAEGDKCVVEPRNLSFLQDQSVALLCLRCLDEIDTGPLGENGSQPIAILVWLSINKRGFLLSLKL